MKTEYFTEYVLENGEMREHRVSKKDAMAEIRRVLKQDKEFLEIMAKM